MSIWEKSNPKPPEVRSDPFAGSFVSPFANKHPPDSRDQSNEGSYPCCFENGLQPVEIMPTPQGAIWQKGCIVLFGVPLELRDEGTIHRFGWKLVIQAALDLAARWTVPRFLIVQLIPCRRPGTTAVILPAGRSFNSYTVDFRTVAAQIHYFYRRLRRWGQFFPVCPGRVVRHSGQGVPAQTANQCQNQQNDRVSKNQGICPSIYS
jgi:hypothetical protein